MKLSVGSRGSKLALTQTKMVIAALKEKHPDLEVELKIIQTKGDVILDKPLSEIGDKGLFVKEIEEALYRNEIDLAVHSLKDMPAEEPPGLIMAVTPKRASPGDVLISFQGVKSLGDLPPGAVVATGSLRRESQLLALRPDVKTVGIRGNVETRICKAKEAGYDGVILAAAGLERLGIVYEGFSFAIDEMLPAPAQGILGLEVREGDKIVMDLLRVLHDEDSHRQSVGERTFLRHIDGGCHVPLGAYVAIEGKQFTASGFYEWGGRSCRLSVTGVQGEEEEKCRQLALTLKGMVENEK